jgi:hypothetical protein
MTRRSDDPNDRRETESFEIADQKIWNLLGRLAAKGVCPCCAARALACSAADLAEQVIGSVKAIEMFEDIIHALRESDVPSSARSPSAGVH